MKTNFLLITLLWFSLLAMAQTPDGISYQTIFRDGNGQPYINTQLSVKMTIHAETSAGVIVYSELHQATSNAFGLVNLTIGGGVPLTGNFENIGWGQSSFFLETALDIAGSGQYQVMGVTQFLSVPYSKFSDNSGFTSVANGIQIMSLEERDALVNPYPGMTILNSSTNCLNYYNGSAWFETCGDCQPWPDEANAGPDQTDIIGTTTTLQGNIPQTGNGLWTILSGEGGGFADDTNPNTLFSGIVGESYNLRWTISTGCGSNSDEVIISFSEQTWVCGQDFTDPRDGQVYPTVQIGDQCWMAKNMNIGIMVTSTPTNNGTIEKFCNDDLTSNCDVYGGLYPWDEMMNYTTIEAAQGICPTNWHIPTDAQWCALTTYLDAAVDCQASGYTGTDGGGKMKEEGTSHWLFPNTGATNSSGFTALPGGFSFANGSYAPTGTAGVWWLSTQENAQNAWTFSLHTSHGDVGHNRVGKIFGFSVRCMADETTTSQLNVTPEHQDVTHNPGTATFEITSNLNWTVSESEPWLTVTPTGGNNNGTITVTFEANFNPQPRTGQITVTAEGGSPEVIVTVTQSGFQPFVCGQDFTDPRDGQVYPTVLIGDQCWMAKNMNIGTMVTITPTNNGTIEKFCNEDQTSNCDVYGGLYPWDEAMEYTTNPGAQGICPTGWHIPTDAQWCALTTYLDSTVDCQASGYTGTDAGGKMKETGTSHWLFPNTGATNSSGFKALPGGFSFANGTFVPTGTAGLWWLSTQDNAQNTWTFNLHAAHADVGHNISGKIFGYSVRCMADKTTTSQLNVTPEHQDVTHNPGTATFEITSNLNWTVSESEPWLTVTPTGGNNNGTITVTFEANFNPQPRTGQITVTAKGGSPEVIVTVTQSGFQPFVCEDFTDPRDGQVYSTVLIDDQCWMAENLNIGTMIDEPNYPANNQIIEKYCYSNIAGNCDVYGGLYQWSEMMQYSNTPGIQGICPTGWHLPELADYQTLIQAGGGFINPHTGGILKSTGTIQQGTGLWNEPNTGATNETGFTAHPGGSINLSGELSPELERIFKNSGSVSSDGTKSSDNLGEFALFWDSSPEARFLMIDYLSTTSGIFNSGPALHLAFSVRCLKD